MDTATEPAKPRRGRRPKAETAPLDSSKLKKIQLDEDLKELINRKNSPSQLESYRVKLPLPVVEEIKINVESLKQSGNTKIDENSYVKYALELANENLADILRKHLSQ